MSNFKTDNFVDRVMNKILIICLKNVISFGTLNICED